MQSVTLFNLVCEKYPKSRVFLDIFDGGHEMDLVSARYWLTSQVIKRSNTAVSG